MEDRACLARHIRLLTQLAVLEYSPAPWGVIVEFTGDGGVTTSPSRGAISDRTSGAAEAAHSARNLGHCASAGAPARGAVPCRACGAVEDQLLCHEPPSRLEHVPARCEKDPRIVSDLIRIHAQTTLSASSPIRRIASPCTRDACMYAHARVKGVRGRVPVR